MSPMLTYRVLPLSESIDQGAVFVDDIDLESAKLRTNALMYAMAEKYEIEDLRTRSPQICQRRGERLAILAIQSICLRC